MSIDVVGIPMFDGTLNDAVEMIHDICRSSSSRESRLISATGAHGLTTARRDPSFARVLTSFHSNLADGMPSVWVGRLKGASRMERSYGPDVFAAVMRRTADTGIRHFLCGGKDGVAEELARAVALKFGNNGVVGTFCPPFREMTTHELEELGSAVQQSKADIVWIGLSTPKQERFALALKKYCRVHFIITVGAAFDFHTDRVRQAPRGMQRAGLEWLFRLSVEPRRLFRRYATIVPLFLLYSIWDLILFHLRKRPFSGKLDT